MTPREANAVLALAGQYDGRKPDVETAIAWAETLGGLALPDCIDAVKAHYRESTDWLLPAMIRRRVKAIRADRIERGKPFLVPPRELDDLDGTAHAVGYQRWLAGATRALADGHDPRAATPTRAAMPAEVRAALAELRPPTTEPTEETT